MKFCKNCQMQLADDATFCEECGAKQDMPAPVPVPVPAKENTAPSQKDVEYVEAESVDKQEEEIVPKLSKTCKPAKRGINGWIMFILFLVCSPIALLFIFHYCLPSSFPRYAYYALFYGLPLAVMTLMFKTSRWNIFFKILALAAYIGLYVFIFI